MNAHKDQKRRSFTSLADSGQTQLPILLPPLSATMAQVGLPNDISIDIPQCHA